jgi:hypothetical protein
MKETEVVENKKSLGEAALGFAKAAWTAKTGYRGLNLEQLVQFLFVQKKDNDAERELTGDEISARLADFRFKNRLNSLTGIAFQDMNREGIWNNIKIDGKTAEEMWSDKYAHVEDKAEKEQMYQFELLRQLFDGTSAITADAENGPVTIVPEGPRKDIKRAIMAEEPTLNETAVEDPEMYEDEPAQEAPAVEEKAPEVKGDSLTEETLNNFADNAYDRLWRTNPDIGVYASPASMVNAVFDKNPTAEGIIERYQKLKLKNELDISAIEFMKEIDSPERVAFLKEQGIDTSKLIKVDGQTLDERYGEKYKSVENADLKGQLYKMELMYEIVSAHLAGKKGVVPEITVDRYELKDGSYQPVESKIKVVRPVRKVKTEDVKPEEPAAEVKVEITPEQIRANILAHEDRIVQDQIKMVKDPNAKPLEATEAKWNMAKQANDIHKELKNVLVTLDSVKKNKILGKDTALYGNMITALKDCITLSDLDNPQANTNKLIDALDKYNKASKDYYDNRKGLIFGPGSDAGKLRLNEAKNATLRIPGQIEELKKTAELAGHSFYRIAPFAYVAEAAMNEAASIGSDKYSIKEFDNKFGLNYLEAAAKDYLIKHKKEVNEQSIADLSLDNEFINVVERYPSHYSEKYDQFNAAKDYLKTHYKKIAADKTLDAKTVENASNFVGSYDLINAAHNLIQNPDFVRMYSQNPDFYIQNIELKNKAEAYLTEKNGEKPSAEQIKELNSNKVFRMISEKNPTDFGKHWDDNKKKADELKEKYKAELDKMTENLEDNDVISYLKEYYDPDEKPNPEYEKALDALKEKKTAVKKEKERIYEERQALKEITDPEERKQKEEQIEKDADALEKAAKSVKSGKAEAVREHLLPEYLARVAFLKTTQDPVKGENICRLMATNPRQEKDAYESILVNVKKPENAKLLKSKELTDMIKDGSIVEKVVPGAQKPEQAKKPEAKKPQQEKKMEGGMARK